MINVSSVVHISSDLVYIIELAKVDPESSVLARGAFAPMVLELVLTKLPGLAMAQVPPHLVLALVLAQVQMAMAQVPPHLELALVLD